MGLLPTLFGKVGLDERFIAHRFRSTRLALAAGLLAMVAWFNYEWWAREVIRWDYLAILGIMALTKVVAMVYLQRTR